MNEYMQLISFLNQVIILFKKYSLVKMGFLNHNLVLPIRIEIDIFDRSEGTPSV